VHFSDAGDPETFGVNNYVTLWPGDGEGITGLVRWRDMVFAFKRSRFAVFYGTSTDGTGNPIFNYRSVDAGVGCLQQGAAVAGEDGVYFATLTGLYRTTGGDPVLVSKPVEPWLHRDVTVPAVISGNPTLAYHRGRVYVNYPSAGVQGVYDTQTGEWTAWNLAANRQRDRDHLALPVRLLRGRRAGRGRLHPQHATVGHRPADGERAHRPRHDGRRRVGRDARDEPGVPRRAITRRRTRAGCSATS
jgi:hypothetical protein